MARTLQRISHDYELGDSWTPEAANEAPALSDTMQEAWEREHFPDGTHRLPAPQAYAVVTWTGSAYALTASYGITSISSVGTGLVSFTLSKAMRSAQDWAVDVQASRGVWGCSISDLQTTTTGRIRLVQRTGSGGTYDFAAVNTSFVMIVYGVRANEAESRLDPSLAGHRMLTDDVIPVELINRTQESVSDLADAFAEEHQREHSWNHRVPIVPRAVALIANPEDPNDINNDPEYRVVWTAGRWTSPPEISQGTTELGAVVFGQVNGGFGLRAAHTVLSTETAQTNTPMLATINVGTPGRVDAVLEPYASRLSLLIVYGDPNGLD